MNEIVNKSMCTGCTACFASCPVNAIEMVTNEGGFLYPKINQSICINCGKCKKVCPIRNESNKNHVLDSYIGRNINKDIRNESASGGIFTCIAEWVLQKKGVVFGAAYTDELIVKHISIYDIKDLQRLRMSKYVQSDIGQCFEQVKQLLHSDRYVLFSGTPCQIEGLNSFLGKKYDKLILMDVVCHGVPSPLLFEKYKAQIKENYNINIKNIFFRSKILGHSCSTIMVESTDGKKLHSRRLIKSYPRLWFLGYISRECCYNCNFKVIDRVSDFTLFDSFKSANIYEYSDDDRGLSNVYIRTDKARKVIQDISAKVSMIKTDYIITSERDGDMIFESAYKNKRYDEFWLDVSQQNYTFLIDKYMNYSKKEKIFDYIKQILVRFKLSNLKVVRTLLKKLKN